MAQNFWTAIWAFSVNFVLTVIISLFTKPHEEEELVGLVYSLTPKPAEHTMTLVVASNLDRGRADCDAGGLNLIFR